MSDLRQQEAAESAPGAGADRAWRRRQAGHDQRRIPDRVVAGHGGALPKACEPAHRRGHAARADRSRSADEHQLLCGAQFLGAGPERRRAQGGTDRRQLRQGLHRRAGRSQRADGGDRALFRNFSRRRDQDDAAVYGFRAGRCHSSQRRPAVQRRAIIAGADRRQRMRTRHNQPRRHSIRRPRSNGRRSGRCATTASNIFRPACCIFSTAVLPPSMRIPTAARPATRSRKPSSRVSSNWWNEMPTRSGGTIDCNGRKSTSPISTIPMFAICKASSPKPDGGFGCSTSPAISAFPPMWRYCTGCKTDRKISSSVPARISINRIAMLRTLTELNQFLSIGLMGGGTGEKSSLDGITPLRLEELSLPDAESAIRRSHRTSARSSVLSTTRATQVDACVDIARRAGLDFLVLNQTRPDVEVNVVRVIVPGLRHFYRRFGPGRLYDVPVKLGWLDRPLPESELTPFLPHYLRGHPACALPQKRKRGGSRHQAFPPG